MKFFVFLMLLMTTYVSFSQDTIKVYEKHITDSIFQLQEVEIMSVYRIDDKIPITQKTIKLKEIQSLDKSKDIPTLLSSTPSMISHSDNGLYQGYTYMRLRGVDQTRINITLNGVPLNEPEDQGAYFSNYPDFLSSMNSIQIQRGVGTSTNGTSSYIGSINFESFNLKEKSYNNFHTDFGNYKSNRIIVNSQKLLDTDFPLYIRYSDISTDGYKYNSFNHSKSVFLSTAFYTEKNIVKLVGFFGQQSNGMAWLGAPKDSIKNDRKYNTHYGNEYDLFHQSHIQAHFIRSLDEKSTITNTFYFNYLNGNYDFDLNSFLLLPKNTLDSVFYNYWMESKFYGFTSNYSYKNKKLRLYMGFNANKYQREHIGSESKIGKLYDNTGYKNEFSTYIKALYDIGNFTLFGDVQYRYTNFDYVGDVNFEQMDWIFINPKVGLNFNINNSNKLYYSLGKTGREPTRTDIFMGEDNLWTIDGFSNIKPEFVIDNELGYIYNTTNLYFSTNVFYIDFENEIVINGQFGSNSLPLHSNVANSIRYGLEFDFEYNFNKIRLTNSSSYSQNKIKEDNNETIHIMSPSLIINQNISYSLKPFYFTLMFRYQDKSYIDYGNLYSIDEFYTFDFKTLYHKGIFTVGIAINNIFDKNYFSYGHMNYDNSIPLYHIGVPRNISISIDAKI